MPDKIVYGFDPGYALRIGTKPYLIKFPFKYIGEDNRCWVDPGPSYMQLGHIVTPQPQWLAAGHYSFDINEARMMLAKYLAEHQVMDAMSDDDWVKYDTRKYLECFFNKDLADDYMIAIEKLNNGDWWHSYIRIVDDKVYFQTIPDWHSSPLKPERYSSHKETNAERLARYERQIEENKRRLREDYIEVKL